MSTPEKPEKLLTAKEVRQRLRIAPRTLYDYRQQGRIACSKVNSRRFLYSAASVEKLLAENGAAINAPK